MGEGDTDAILLPHLIELLVRQGQDLCCGEALVSLWHILVPASDQACLNIADKVLTAIPAWRRIAAHMTPVSTAGMCMIYWSRNSSRTSAMSHPTCMQ